MAFANEWSTVESGYRTKKPSPKIYSSSSYDQDTIKINPYNPNNFLASKEQVEEILRKVGINLPVRNMKLYQLAFTHKSYLKRILQNRNLDVHVDKEPGTLELQDDSNERLEFLGDQITNSIIVYFLYRTYPTEQEGFLTKLKTNLISTQFYAKFARYLGLQRFLVVSKHVEEQCNGRNNDKILENVFESFMGALFEDFSTIPSVYTQKLGLISGPGYEICEKLVVHLMQKLIDFDDIVANDTNYKDILLRFYQATFQIVPKYVEISSCGPPNNRIFTMGVYDKDNNIAGRGVGNSKKKAEQLASQDALKYFGRL